MRKRKKSWKKITVLAAAVVLIWSPCPCPAAETGADTYQESSVSGNQLTVDPDTNMLSGQFQTSGELTRIEIYVSGAYLYTDNNIYLMKTGSETRIRLNGDRVEYDGGEHGDEEVYYGGVVPVNGYNLNCLIYYIAAPDEGTLQWSFSAVWNENLTECLVAQSEVPADWQNPSGAVITQPQAFLLGFIDSKSAYVSTPIETILTTDVTKTDAESKGFKAAGKTEEKDPMQTVLLILMGIVAMAIIATAIVIRKDKKMKEEKRGEDVIKRTAARAKEKKKNENAELKSFFEGCEDDYSDSWDEDESPKEIEKESEKEKTTLPNPENISQRQYSAPQQTPETDEVAGAVPGTEPAQGQPFMNPVQNAVPYRRPANSGTVPAPCAAPQGYYQEGMQTVPPQWLPQQAQVAWDNQMPLAQIPYPPVQTMNQGWNMGTPQNSIPYPEPGMPDRIIQNQSPKKPVQKNQAPAKHIPAFARKD